jgi:hypothetical protein
VVGLPPNGLVALECDASLTDLVISFDAPESQQTTTVVVTGDSDGLEVVIVDGIVTATATINWTPDSAANVVLQFNATDSEGASTLQSLTISSPGPCNVGSNGDPHCEYISMCANCLLWSVCSNLSLSNPVVFVLVFFQSRPGSKNTLSTMVSVIWFLQRTRTLQAALAWMCKSVPS